MKRTNTALLLLLFCALACTGCISVHTEQNTTTFTHAWWTFVTDSRTLDLATRRQD
jgi:hypothetical protein